MKLTEITIKRNRLSIGIMLVITLLGIIAYKNMPRDMFPPFTMRYASIVTIFPGATPERVEMLISDKIEKVIQEMPEVDFLTSESRTSISVVGVAIKQSESEMRPIFDEIRRKVEDMKMTLPEGIIGPQVNDDLAETYGILVGLTGEGYSYAELKEVADDVRDALIKIPNAAEVVIAGAQEEQIFIDYDNAQLANLGLTKTGLQQILASTNIIFPGGDISLGEERIMLEPTGNFETIEDIKKTIIKSTEENQIVSLGDIANVYRGYTEPRKSIVKINGTPGLILGVSVKENGNMIELGKKVDMKLDELREEYPIGIEFERVASLDDIVNDQVNEFIVNVAQSVCIVLFVMLLFLGFRTGMVVACLIPLAIIMTLFIMSKINVGLNVVSLASLIMALGMLVDNAIVVSESIMVKIRNGEDPFHSAIHTTKELAVPLLIASLTTSAAFLSFFLAKCMVGEMFAPIFIVVSLALLSSWFLSITIIAMLCMYFLKVKGQKPNSKKSGFERMKEPYRKLLLLNLKRPYILLLSIVVMFIMAMWGFSFVPAMFMGESNDPQIFANIELPLGTSIERTEEVISDIERFIKDSLYTDSKEQLGVEKWSSFIGEGPPAYVLGFMPPEASPNWAHLLIYTTSGDANQMVIDKISSYCFNKYPEMVAHVSKLSEGGGSGYPIAIRLTGKDTDKLFDIADKIKHKLTNTEGTKNITDDWGGRNKKLVIKIDPTRAQLAGITNQDIAVSLRTFLTGARTGEFREEDKAIPIIMRNAQKGEWNISRLEGLNVYSQMTGKNVPLKQVADIVVEWQYSRIKRRDIERTVTVLADVRSGYNVAEITKQIVTWLKEEDQNWGRGYTYSLGGEDEEMADAMDAVVKNFPLSIFLILLLLIAQFNSVRKTIIVLLTIPLGLIGVVIGLLAAQSYFGFLTLLGVVSLSGIIVNNGIVLLDRIKIELDEFGRAPQEAIILAAQQRFRPILLTTATTSLGLLPLWFGGGGMWPPMAISIIFGLIFGTIITLLFVPVMYKVFFKVSFKEYQNIN